MVLMVLDHTRDFFTDIRVDPTNLATTTIPLFFTRWVTHFCAPLFVFLAGSSAYLMRALGKQASATRQVHFLASRGLFLVIVELTLVRLGWFFTWSFDQMFLTVIWAIGMSMVLLSLALAFRVPSQVIGILGAAIILGHNILDLPSIVGSAGSGKPPAPQTAILTILLRPGPLFLAPGVTWIVAYPVLPWFGIIALGYAFGEILIKERWSRIRITTCLGLGTTLAFALLRAWGVYGDPAQFQVQSSAGMTLVAFLDCQKYPPSLLYTLMTLGPGLLLLAGLDATEGEIALHGQRVSGAHRFLVTLGRVPLFYYLLQWPLIHVLAVVTGALAGQPLPVFAPPFDYPPGYGYSLPFVYMMWVLVVAILYIPCRWYAALKLRRRDLTWLSYV
jgi:uncharacterized membrane protein